MASYLVRFDDICPTMNWEIWSRVEEILVRHGVQPIVGVVPDNHDPSLEHSAPAPDFWGRVRAWDAAGWTIAIHGHQHRYTTDAAGIVGIKKRSEFAGLPLASQLAKLEAARAVFEAHGVRPLTWVAPGHSFDDNTVAALRAIGIPYISDGLFLYPRVDRRGAVWIPQQLWRFRSMPFGVWTVCMHHSRWGEKDLARFERSIVQFRDRITSLPEIAEKFAGRRPANINGMLPRFLLTCLRLKTVWHARSAARGRV